MDSDDEMMIQTFLDEQADADADEEGHLLIIAALLQLQVDEENNANPKRGGSWPGRRKSKPRQRMEGHVMLYTDYFADVPTYTQRIFAGAIG